MQRLKTKRPTQKSTRSISTTAVKSKSLPARLIRLKKSPRNVLTQSQRFNSATTEMRRVMCKPSSKLAAGIVGMPNIGKSLIFNCLSEQNVPSENYPFCTIEPSSAIVAVPDNRLEVLNEISKSQRIINSTLTVTDIAGLVRGASEGKGLGNEFLANIQSVDTIFHLVRLFPHPKSRDVEHVEGSISPVRDLEIISNELLLKDKKTLALALQKITKQASKASADPTMMAQLSAVKKATALVEKGFDIREGNYTEAESNALVSVGLLTAKPVVYILNCSTEEYLQQYSPIMAEARDWIKKRSPGSVSILFSGDWEADLALIPKEDQPEYVAEMTEAYPLHPTHQPLIDYGDLVEPSILTNQALEIVNKTKSALPIMLCAAFSSLNLIQYFTTGEMETRSWQIKRGDTAPEAAGQIHTTFTTNFVAADVIFFDDMVEHRDEEVLKKLGKIKTQGKGYIVQDGDIMNFKIGAAKK